MRRGVGAKRWNGDDLDACEVWIDRTDGNEIQLRIEHGTGVSDDAVDVYLTLDEAETVAELLASSKAEAWRRA